MATVPDSELSPSIYGVFKPGNEGQLRTDSYTALLLQYLTPQAMHIESRVLFLGDIPNDKERKSRREWRSRLDWLIRRKPKSAELEKKTIEPLHTVKPVPSASNPARDNYATTTDLVSRSSSGTWATAESSLAASHRSVVQDGSYIPPSKPSFSTQIPPKYTLDTIIERSPEPMSQLEGSPGGFPDPSPFPPRSVKSADNTFEESSISTNEYAPSMASKSSSKTTESPNTVFKSHFLVQVRHRSRRNATVIDQISEGKGPPTRLSSRWKEYVAVATRNNPVGLVIRLYATTSAARLTKHKKYHRSTWKLKVGPRWSVGFFSTLDLTLALWGPEVRTVFVFQASDLGMLLEWTELLCSATHSPHFPLLHPLVVKFPSAEFEMHIPSSWVPPPQPQPELSALGALLATDKGNHMGTPCNDQNPISVLSISDLMALAVSVGERQNAIMKEVWRNAKVLERRTAMDLGGFLKFGLAWRHATRRLLWVTPRSGEDLLKLRWLLEDDYNLEMVPVLPRATPDEPPPVEGFCQRVTSWIGKLKNQQAATYLHTHNNLLFHSAASKADPPPIWTSDSVNEHEIAPFALSQDGCGIEWLTGCRNLRDVDWFDSLAVIERDRRVRLINNAEGVVDMVSLLEITPCPEVATDFILRGASHSGIRMRVSSPQVRDSWVRRLNNLIVYWKRQQYEESLKRQASEPNFYVTSVIRNRSILVSGFLYHKKHKSASFRRYFSVLTRNSLVMFEVERGANPVASTLKQTQMEQLNFRFRCCYELTDSYVYSGYLAEDFLMSTDSFLDPNNPGIQALPRAFDDGCISQDTEQDRCFIVWRSMRWRVIHRLAGSPDRPMTFLARSKLDRDIWVSCLRHAMSE